MPIDFHRAVKHVKIDGIRPNPWNPAKSDEKALVDGTIRSVQQVGFAGAIIVRRVGSMFEIIDGEHRWKALKEMGAETCPVISLGEVEDDIARLMTLNFNLIHGEMVAVDVAEVVRDLDEKVGREKLNEMLVMTSESIQELVDLAGVDWEEQATANPSERVVDKIKRTFVFTPDAHRVVVEALERAGAKLGTDNEAEALYDICGCFTQEQTGRPTEGD